MARPRKSPQLRALEGEQPCRARRAPVAEPGRFPEPPPYLSDAEEYAWFRVQKALEAAGHLAPTDAEALEIYCVTYARWRKAVEDLADEGLTLEGPRGGLSLNPLVAVASDASKTMIRLLIQLGMTPVARNQVTPTEDPADDPILKFLAGGQDAPKAPAKPKAKAGA